MTTGDSKTCTKCGEAKPLSEYHKRHGTPVAWCKACKRAYDKKRREQKGDVLLAQRRQWYVRSRNANLAYQAEWRKKNKDRKAASDKEWREANADRKKANDAAWREANRDKTAAYFRDLYHAKKHDPEYRAQRAIRKAKRRALEAGVEHTPYRREDIYDRDQGTCRGCGSQLPLDQYEVDHIVPIALGGPDTPANLQLMCGPCNRKKWMTLEGQIHLPV